MSKNPGAENYYLKRLANEHNGHIEALKKKDPALLMDRPDQYLEQYKQVRHDGQNLRKR